MRTLLLSLCLTTFMVPVPLAAASPAEDYHVMYTNVKGKPKCCNKSSKEKADKCADKIRAKGKAKDVQVMAGKCKDM